jgi:hypothetical protein
LVGKLGKLGVLASNIGIDLTLRITMSEALKRRNRAAAERYRRRIDLATLAGALGSDALRQKVMEGSAHDLAGRKIASRRPRRRL